MSRPTNDEFRRFNIFPTPDDLKGKRDPSLKKNKVEGSYKDTKDYLDVHVRLLREDFLDPWRQTRNKVRSRNRGGHQTRSVDEVEVFRVQQLFLPEDRSTKRPRNDSNNRALIKFDPVHLTELRRPESKRFQHGSLVCMSADNFETIVVATTVGDLDFSDGISLSLSFEIESRVKDEMRIDCWYELIENTGVCFQTYRHFLNVLQNLFTLPFQRYLLDPNGQEIPPPRYLLTKQEGQPVQFNFSSLLNFETISRHQIPLREIVPVLQLDLWPGIDELDLDWSQYNALRTAVTKELAVIQGPPGTGKTFIGVKLVRLLLENNGILGEPSRSDDEGQSNASTLFTGPIILLSHANHALDQFLESIIEIYPEKTYEVTRSIFRIGGRSKSKNEALKRCILDTIHDKDSDCIVKLKNAKIIAMTTSGAAKHHDIINTLQSKVVIVEEAGIILESHLVASLPQTCEHLILIGDHQQLRPKPASYWLETEYALGVSLFERLVKNSLHSVCLTNQRRMRPEIAELMRQHFYASLQDDESVKEYDDVAGVFGNLLFIDHNEKEGKKDDNGSYSNDHEARFLANFCEYLLGVGYKQSQITILVTYASQEKKIRSLSKWKMPEVRISTVDNYQGEENDIILLSLVRSNERNSIGFLNSPNRVCVALSRARKGLYIIGNGDLLRSTSELWEKILKSLESQNGVISSIRLGCHRHREKNFHVAHESDFKDVPKTGCSETCGLILPRCEHRCKWKCHQLRPDHDEYRCEEKCTKMCSNNLHPCRKRCYEDCLCEEPVDEILPNCHHTVTVPCNIRGHVIDRRCSVCHPVLYFRGPTGRSRDETWNQETSTTNRDMDRQESSEINGRLKRGRRYRLRERRSPSRDQLRNERNNRNKETVATKKRSHRQREHLASEPDSRWSRESKRRRWEDSTAYGSNHSEVQAEMGDWTNHGHSRRSRDSGAYERENERVTNHERRYHQRKGHDAEYRGHRTPPVQSRARHSASAMEQWRQ